jgi:GNAT superfamily N-acetyltransferase
LYSVLAKYKKKTIAFARIVGDGKLCFYIQEVIVHPDHQQKGIATNFMKYIFEYFKNNAVKRSYIGVFSGKGLEKFYKKYGFWERPTGEMGPGMMQFWNDPEFNKHLNKI